MVSQPDPTAQYNLQHRHGHGHSSAASAILPRHSGHTSTRSKRYNRSHAGGDSYSPLNEFPVFSQSGDVEVIIRAGPLENRYLLHREILTRCSGFFEASTSEEWSRARGPDPSTKPKVRQLAAGNEVACVNPNGSILSQADSTTGAGQAAAVSVSGNRRWRYELDPGRGQDDIPMLVQNDPVRDDKIQAAHQSIFATPRPGSSSGPDSGPLSRSRHSNSQSRTAPHSAKGHRSSFSQSLANLSLSSQPRSRSRNNNTVIVAVPEEEDLVRDYDNLFRIFYNYPPLLDGVNVADAYIQCKRLLGLADQYDALAVVGPRVDHHLLQFQARLWKQIAKYPVSYLRLGYLARSKVIFQEALVHVVGQWPVGERSLRASMPDSVLDLIEDKVDDLEYTVSRVERRLFRLTLLNSHGERVSPSSNYLDWLVVSYFREWLTDNTSPPPPSKRTADNKKSSSALANSGAFAPLPALGAIGRAYRTLAGRPNAYLAHSECKEFLKRTPDLYSRDHLRRFEKRLDELKAMARDIVAPLMGSSLELDLAAGGTAGGKPPSDGIRYLTCTSPMASSNRSLHLSDGFAISCGTVAVDPHASKALLIRSRSTGEVYLPKGRKDVHEALPDAALRETWEETGVRAALLPVRIPVLKIIFWFVAMADAGAEMGEGAQQDGEDFEARWVPWDEVGATLTFEDDRRVAEAGIEAAKAARVR
ncbi:NUDIX hydrolase domain-like protein [Cordyceps fumosorosea ARSEF 2679]|uniref:NUDIX hydrolase domain-like protein n=1 Tax=Cordyceps fumosorosea (strain ARSEF 2679) TaxID=1081104 RepID=A0A167WND2_CORFA|nr:NUDIX hydrolase domain-like protein [Cordyceps fumosorosea ARSEF 2679]OAA64007.1 NUDIX hydrolase domain-like protein [Cordyceps fumosorosea ARSEF 2679]